MRVTPISCIGIGLTLALLAGCSGPMGPIPGGELDGEMTPWPADWQFTETIENVLLETNPQDPYSVTVWGVYRENDFYIAAASASSNWVEHIGQNNAVILSIEHKLYAAWATTVTDVDELNDVQQLYVHKYDFDPDSDYVEDEGVLFRLTPRTTELAAHGG